MNEWTEIAKTPPPIGDYNEKNYVLAVDSKGRMSIGYAIKHSSGFIWRFAKPIGEPTYWMQLPEPPKG